MVIFFEELTGEKLYNWPRDDDPNFRYFIMERGLFRTPNDLIESDVWRTLRATQQQEFTRIITRYERLSPDVREIFEHVLRIDPQERWDLDAVAASAYLNPPM